MEQVDLVPEAAAAAEERPRRGRGFASMDPERLRAISSKGGRSAHAKGLAHRFTTEEARAAGKKGGAAPHVSRGRTSRGAS